VKSGQNVNDPVVMKEILEKVSLSHTHTHTHVTRNSLGIVSNLQENEQEWRLQSLVLFFRWSGHWRRRVWHNMLNFHSEPSPMGTSSKRSTRWI